MENSIIFEEVISIYLQKAQSLGNLKNEITREINKTKTAIDSSIINIAVFGDVSCGKSTLISQLISIGTNEENTIMLPVSDSENTYYSTIIESSPDNKYYLKKIKSGIEETKIVSICPDDINIYLEKKDDKSVEQLKTFKHDGKEIYYFKIQIPKFPKNFRLIDTPGLSNPKLMAQIYKLLDGEYFYFLILFLKNMTAIGESDQIAEFFKTIKSKYTNSSFSVCFTQYDNLISNYYQKSKFYKQNQKSDYKITRDFKKKVDQLRSFEKIITNINQFLKLSEFFIVNCKGDTDFSKSQIKKIYNFLDNFISTEKNSIKIACFVNKLNIQLIELNNKTSKIDLFNENEKIDKEKLEKLKKDFKSNLEIWKNSFLVSLEDSKIYSKIKFYDENELNKENFYSRENYCKKMTFLLSNYFLSEINEEVGKIFTDNLRSIKDLIPPSALNKLDNIVENFTTLDFDEKAGLSIGSSAVLSGITGDLIVFALSRAGSVFAFTPIGLGLLTIGGALSIYSGKKYFGIWTRSGCHDEIKDQFYNKIKIWMPNFTNQLTIKFEEKLQSYINIFQLKETLPEIREVMNYMHNLNLKKNNQEKLSDYYSKSVEEFSEEHDTKKFISDLFLNNTIFNS